MESNAHRWYVDTTMTDLKSDRRMFSWLIPVPFVLGIVLLILVSVVTTAYPKFMTELVANVSRIGGALVMGCAFWPFKMWRRSGQELRKWHAQSMLLQQYCEGPTPDPTKCAEQQQKIEGWSAPSGDGV